MKSFDELTTIATNQSKTFCGFWHRFTILMKQKEHTKSRTNDFYDYNSSISTNEQTNKQTNNNILLLLWLIQKIIHILETVQFSLWSIVYQCDETVSLLLNLEASVCAYRFGPLFKRFDTVNIVKSQRTPSNNSELYVRIIFFMFGFV